MAIVELDHIRKRYSKEYVLRDITLSIRRGEITAVVGANGSGKSTLLRVVAGLTAPSGGKRTMDGQPVIAYAPDRLPKLRFTPREYLRHMTNMDRLGSSIGTAESAEKIEWYLERFGMAGTGKLQMKDFSKGMLQKINLIQAFLRDPQLLVLDEPFGGLDEEAARLLADWLNGAKHKNGAVVVASHERAWVSEIADRIVILGGGTIRSDQMSVLGNRPPNKNKIVECLLPPEGGGDEEGRLDGVVRFEANGRRARYTVDSAQSDRLLSQLLEKGASIISVQEKGDLP